MKKSKSKFQIPNSRFQSGFSLVEVVVSLFMIAVLLVLYTSALNVASLTRKLKYENYAYHIANKQMEELRSIPYASLPASGTVIDSLISELPNGSGSFAVANYGSYTNMKEMVVTISWNDGINKDLVLRTLSGVTGLNQ